MFKVFLWTAIFTISTIIGCTSVQKQNRDIAAIVEAKQLPRHVIFLIHGLGGDRNTFGKMQEALEKHLNALTRLNLMQMQRKIENGDKVAKTNFYKWEVFPLEYGTKIKDVVQSNKCGVELPERIKNTEIEDLLPVDCFTLQVGVQIDRYFKSNPIKEGDKISFIAHSQGGIVGLSWMFQAGIKQDPKFQSQYFKYVDAYISLGTPFWGSSMTGVGKFAMTLADMLGYSDKFPFGKDQVDELAFNSDTINYFKKHSLDFAKLINYQNLQKQKYLDENCKTEEERENKNECINLPLAFSNPITSQVRALNIGAKTAVDLPWYISMLTDHNSFDSDIVVDIPSSRYDFIYGDIVNPDYKVPRVATTYNFKDVSFNNKYIAVDAMHAIMPDLKDPKDPNSFKSQKMKIDKQVAMGVAFIGEECLGSFRDCDHPTFKYVVQHLMGFDFATDETALSQVSTYYIDAKLQFPKGVMRKDIKTVVVPMDDEQDKNIDVQRPGRASTRIISTPDNKVFNMLFRGHIKNSYIPLEKRTSDKKNIPFKDEKVVLCFSAPGIKRREIEVKVRASYSTFVTVQFERAKNDDEAAACGEYVYAEDIEPGYN